MSSSLSRRVGGFFFRYRNALFPISFLLIVLLVRPAMPFGSPRVDALFMIAGATIALLGQFLRLFVIGFDYIDRGGRDGKVYASRLVVSGLYAHCRNPMYLANIMMATGIGIFYGSMVTVLVVPACFLLIYLSIVSTEEQFLSRKFGAEYERYCARVPRFLLRFEGMSATLSSFTYDWRKALRKEYGTLAGTLAGLLALLILKQHFVYGMPLGHSDMTTLELLFLPIAFLYGGTRYLKKRTALLNT